MIENLQGEIWKVIEGYSDYWISSMGRVKSVKFNKEKILKQVKDKNGYLRVGLFRNGTVKKTTVHRLVGLAFLENLNPEDKPYINHKIEGKEGKSMNFVFFKQDGSVDEERTTIEWVSHKENMCYGTVIERKKETIKNSTTFKDANVKLNIKKRKQIYQYTTDLELVNIFPSVREAARQTGFPNSSICYCANAKLKTACGYIWSYSLITKVS